jgi:hypothetical protein
VFILWSRVGPEADRIVSDLREKFELLDARRVTWTPERFSENVRRLYGFDLPERADKATGSGSGPFTVYVVRDPGPVYEPRPRSWGMHPANVKAYDSKQLYREWTGGGFRVHASNEPEEAARDVFLLFARTLESFATASSIPWDTEPSPWSADVVGRDGWSSLEQLMIALKVATTAVLEQDQSTRGGRRLTVRVDDLARARQIVRARRGRIAIAGETVQLSLRRSGPRKLHRPTLSAAVRVLKLRAPRIARVAAGLTRPFRSAKGLENRLLRATMRGASSRRGDGPS